MLIKYLSILLSLVFLSSCATKPQVVVDPQSIADVTKYEKDMAECETLSKGYDGTNAVAGSAALGAGAALGTTAAILATGGAYLLPAGIVLAAGGGAALGGGLSKSKVNRAQEKIWANCMTERGYKAFTSND